MCSRAGGGGNSQQGVPGGNRTHGPNVVDLQQMLSFGLAEFSHYLVSLQFSCFWDLSLYQEASKPLQLRVLLPNNSRENFENVSTAMPQSSIKTIFWEKTIRTSKQIIKPNQKKEKKEKTRLALLRQTAS